MGRNVTNTNLAAQQVADVKILQKVNAAHREAFADKYPGQVEHCLRLTMERLQAGLDKRGSVDLARPESWILMPQEIRDLAEAAHRLNEIRNTLK
jgi:hypothetical protein